MLTFLHLSDLHFTTTDSGTQFDRDIEIRERLLDDLGKDGRTDFDAILVTGDVAYHGEAAEFVRANAWFDEVRKKTNVASESLFVIPGNHDVNQAHVKKDSILWDAHQSLRLQNDPRKLEKSLECKLKDTSDLLRPMAEYSYFAAEHGRLSLTSASQLAWVNQLTASLDDATPVRLHGLNSAFLSDEGDCRANLLVGPFQFHDLAAQFDGVNLVMCHHPPSWLIDGNDVEKRFRNHAHIVLTGHEHESNCFPQGKGLRICAGAVHPSRGESPWQPGYNVIRLSVESHSQRTLVTQVETRIWDNNVKFCFVGSPYSEESKFYEHRQVLPPVTIDPVPRSCHNIELESPNTSVLSSTVPDKSTNEQQAAFAAGRRKLIVHFFRLSTIARYKTVIAAGVWDDSDDAFEGQERWARVFERAERENKLSALWEEVGATDETLRDYPNPFITLY